MKFILISGLSGAGKSKAASFLEDMGYYVVDNMPAALIPKFAELCMAGQGQYDRVALVTDIRGGQTFDGLFSALDQLHEMGCDYKILFVEATLETIVKRYKETRRIHPLAKTAAPWQRRSAWSGRLWSPSASGRNTSWTRPHSPPQNCAGRCSASLERGTERRP